jgi:transcriptional regulator with XRE-family HTH domain
MRRYRSLVEYFEHSGDTQQALAARIGTSQAQISLWTRGLSLPRLDRALRLERITGVPLKKILKAKRRKEAA